MELNEYCGGATQKRQPPAKRYKQAVDRNQLYIILLFSLIFCRCHDTEKSDDEILGHSSEKLDSSKFTLYFYVKSASDSSSIIFDTVLGSLDDRKEIKYSWYDDSVICYVPFKYPDTTFITSKKRKIIIKSTVTQ